MDLRGLIDELTRLLEDGVPDDTVVKFAYQPNYPLCCGIGTVAVADENEPDPDDFDPDDPDYEPDGDREPAYVVYLGESWERGDYLSGAGRRALEWS